MNDAEVEVEGDPVEPDADSLVPDLRAIGDITAGVPIVIEGETWLLAHGGAAGMLDAHRDRLDDKARLRGEVDMTDVLDVARVLLMSNYELTDFEVVALLIAADREKLAAAVMAALFSGKVGHRTYSRWMNASLYAAGLDPARIPPELIPDVLEMLVATRRAVPIDKFTDAAIAAPKLAEARARAEAYAEKQAELAAKRGPQPPEVEAPPVEAPPVEVAP
jgi:hypothetical protein